LIKVILFYYFLFSITDVKILKFKKVLAYLYEI